MVRRAHELCKEYKHIEWLLANLDLYQVTEKGKELCDELMCYGGNYHIYPFEAQTAYYNFRIHIWNNPFLYETTAPEALEIESEYYIFATSVDGYFIEYEEAGVSYHLPIGFIREELGEKANICLIQREIEKMIREFHAQKNIVEKHFEDGINQYEQIRIDIIKQRMGEKFVEKNRDKSSLLEKQFDSSNTAITVFMVFLLSVFFFCMRFIENKRGLFAFAGVMLGGYSCWLVDNMISMRLCLKSIRRKIGNIQYYWQNYRNISMCGIDFESIYSRKEKESIKPIELVPKYSSIKSLLSDAGVSKKKKLLIYHRYWDYLTMFVAAILIICVFVASGIFRFERSNTDLNDNISQTDIENFEIIQESIQEATSEPEVYEVFDKNGLVFSDSDSRYLTEPELYALKEIEGYEFQDLLGYARNEIYARHGYPFNETGKYYPFYMQYSWYSDIPHQVIGDADLNTYEKANIDLIVQIETEYGYR